MDAHSGHVDICHTTTVLLHVSNVSLVYTNRGDVARRETKRNSVEGESDFDVFRC